MPKITDEPLSLFKVRLFDKDLEKLKALYGNTIGIAKAIRTIVRSHVNAIDNEANRRIDEMERKAPASEEGALGPVNSLDNVL